MKLFLASKSPRRRQLLAELGYPVEFVDIDVDEHVAPGTPAADIAEQLACRKAAAVNLSSPLFSPDAVLVTADTVVVLDGEVLGKPVDHDDAVRMLQRLSGRDHTVYTGVCLRSREQQVSFTEHTDVFFRPLTDEDIHYYVEHCRPYDKAGAYGIQEWIGMVGVSRIDGCYYNVMGLPLARLYRALRERFSSK